MELSPGHVLKANVQGKFQLIAFLAGGEGNTKRKSFRRTFTFTLRCSSLLLAPSMTL